MPICPYCGAKYQLATKYESPLDQATHCPKCGVIFTLGGKSVTTVMLGETKKAEKQECFGQYDFRSERCQNCGYRVRCRSARAERGNVSS